jgi:hypothetical protein
MGRVVALVRRAKAHVDRFGHLPNTHREPRTETPERSAGGVSLRWGRCADARGIDQPAVPM